MLSPVLPQKCFAHENAASLGKALKMLIRIDKPTALSGPTGTLNVAERAVLRLRQIALLPKFASAHAIVHTQLVSPPFRSTRNAGS